MDEGCLHALFVGAAVSLIPFRERPAALLLAGAALMALGVWLHLTERHEHEHHHEQMQHEHAHVHDAHHRHEHGVGDPPVDHAVRVPVAWDSDTDTPA